MRIDVYRDKKGEWRWRMVARNGRIIADSGESYKRKKACVDIATKIATTDMIVSVEE